MAVSLIIYKTVGREDYQKVIEAAVTNNAGYHDTKFGWEDLEAEGKGVSGLDECLKRLDRREVLISFNKRGLLHPAWILRYIEGSKEDVDYRGVLY